MTLFVSVVLMVFGQLFVTIEGLLAVVVSLRLGVLVIEFVLVVIPDISVHVAIVCDLMIVVAQTSSSVVRVVLLSTVKVSYLLADDDDYVLL